ncbi:MAG: hypothetical protein Q8910_00140 [Bacteroidota bacterium]|nr:hypothetical protein [Bacteroidota bacterium]
MEKELAIKVAEFMGYTDVIVSDNLFPGLYGKAHGEELRQKLPWYPLDLSATYDLEEKVKEKHLEEYYTCALLKLLGDKPGQSTAMWYWSVIHTTAKQKCIAAIEAQKVAFETNNA